MVQQDLKKNNMCKKCGCNTCETKGPLLTEGKVKSLLSEGLQYHIDKKIPLFETVYRIGSDKHLALIKEARKMYSRNVIDLCEDDKVLIGTNLGEFALYEGESVPLDLPMLDESDSNYPDFELNKNIRYQEGSISSGMWRYTGQEQGGKGVYRNLNNDQILAFDRNDFDIFRKHLSSHFDFSESINESKMPTQDQVDKFFALTNNEMHYLNSKPVAGQEKTFNKMEVEPWDEYDLSNFNSLVRKAKSKGKINENKAIITFKNDYEVKMNHIAGYDDDFEHFEAGERESVYILDKNAPSQRVHVEFGDGTNAFIPKDVISFQEKSLNEVEKDINQLKNLSNRKERYNYIKNFSKEKLIDIADELYLDYEEYDDIEDKVLNSFGESLNEGEYRIEYEDEEVRDEDLNVFISYLTEIVESTTQIEEATYKGRKVKLNKPMRGDIKKFKVYVNSGKKNADGSIKVKKVEFGSRGMNIKKNNPVRRKAFRARHKCDTPGPKTKARYWSCKAW